MKQSLIAFSLCFLAVSQAYASSQIEVAPFDRESCTRPAGAYVWPGAKIRSISNDSKSYAMRYEFDREGRMVKSVLGPDTTSYEWAGDKLVQAGRKFFTHHPSGWLEIDGDDEFRVNVERRQDGKILVWKFRTKTGEFSKDLSGQIIMIAYDGSCRELSQSNSHSAIISYPSGQATYSQSTWHTRVTADAAGSWSSEAFNGWTRNYTNDGLLQSYVSPIKGSPTPVIDTYTYERDSKLGRIYKMVQQTTGRQGSSADNKKVYTYKYYD
jgi:hypothetical protein